MWNLTIILPRCDCVLTCECYADLLIVSSNVTPPIALEKAALS
jgi:hypothetical protein